MDELAALANASDDEGNDEGAFRNLMDGAPADEPETPADVNHGPDSGQDQDPRAKVASMMATLDDLEAVATAHGSEPPSPGVPFEGKGMYEELQKQRASVEAKKKDIEKLKASTDEHSAAAAEIETQIAEIEAAQKVELEALAGEQAEERAKTERVLASMQETRADELRQIEENERLIEKLDKSLAEMETRSSELEQMIASAQEAAAEAAAKADQELGVQTSEVEQSTREVRQRVAAEAAKAEAARNHLKDRKIQLADVVARNEDSSKRGDAFEKNLEKKRQAKANTQAQLAALEAQAAGLVAAKGKNEVEAARLGSVASDVKATTTMLERAVAKSLLSQEKVDSAVAATIQQTARLEAKVKALEEEKERVLRKITNYEEASQAFCFNFSAMFDVPSADMPSAATRMPPKQPSTTEGALAGN